MIDIAFIDKELEFFTLTISDIIKSLSLEDVEDFLRSLGVEQIERTSKYIICPTICHNPIEEATSMKLYWYDENKMFHCYTECGENMTIFELYQKYMSINFYPVSKQEAIDYVKQFITKFEISSNGERTRKNLIDRKKYESRNQYAKNTNYSETIMERFIPYCHPTWLREGISEQSIKKFGIRFHIKENQIIIPYYDINKNLIGIRCRELEEDKIEDYGKYHPLYFNNIQFSHSLGQNLYGIYENQKTIKRMRRAIIVEAEKSVLLDNTYNDDYSITLACCGHNISKYQINLLTRVLGVSEITIAFDKEYEDVKDEKAEKDKKLLQDICSRYKNHAVFSYIWDKENLLEEKDSPFDKGKDIWEYLYKNRIKVK